MHIIDDILIEEDIIHSFFACDLEKCKGACCTFPGEYGAPLLNEEISIIESFLENVKEFLSSRAIEIINSSGFYRGGTNHYTTQCIDKRDCVFVYYDNVIAKCALEKAYLAKKTNWRKPLSCHLFPIRIKKYSQIHLHYEKIPECLPGIVKGTINNQHLIISLNEALIIAFGEDWTNKVKALLNQT